MATGGMDLDIKVICSVCLEPYRHDRGCEPKILPCFHTFCLSCLEQIANKETPKEQSAKVNDKPLPVNLTCPTCRTITPVPSGGVARFQTNFYLDDDHEIKAANPPPCNFCDGIHDARFCCSTCEKDLCLECRRYHDRLCTGVVWKLVLPATTKARSATYAASSEETEDQLNVLEDVLKKLGEKEEKVSREKKSIEEDILACYMTTLQRASEARDTALSSLGTAMAELTGSLQQCRTQATKTKAALQNGLAFSQPLAVVSALEKLNVPSSLQHSTSATSGVLVNCLQSFIGTVALHGSPDASQGRQPPAPAAGESSQSLKGCGACIKDIEGIKQQLQDLTSKLKKTNTMMSSHQQEVASLRNKYQQDFAAMLSDNDKQQIGVSIVGADMAINQRDLGMTMKKVTCLRQSVKSQEDALAENTRKIAELDTKLCTYEAKKELNCKELQQSVKALEDKLAKNTNTSWITKQDKDLSGMTSHVPLEETVRPTEIKEHTQRTWNRFSLPIPCVFPKMYRASFAECPTSFSECQAVSEPDTKQRTLFSSVVSCGKPQQSMKALEEKIIKFSCYPGFSRRTEAVTFHVLLDKTVRTTARRCIFMKDVKSNVGNGYDVTTGIFTVPVTGEYDFSATASPQKSGKECEAFIMLKYLEEYVSLGYRDGYMAQLRGEGMIDSSCSASKYLYKGSQVWFESGDGDCLFRGGGSTSFRGTYIGKKMIF